MASEVVKAEVVSIVSRSTNRLEEMRSNLDNLLEEQRLVEQFVMKALEEGTDYGKFPGGDKPSLFKPGADKIGKFFGCTARFPVIEKTEDFAGNFFSFNVRCEMYHRASGEVLAEGVGSCNSHEVKYRYRNSQRTCPSCGKATIIKGKAEYGGGFICFAKKGGCNAKFGENDPAIVSQVIGQIENPDVADQANTMLKMAKKRSQVDAAITLGCVSHVLTQDLEDMQDVVNDKTGEVTRESTVAVFRERIGAAQNQPALMELAEQLKGMKLAPQDREQLARAYSARQAQIAAQGAKKGTEGAKAKVAAKTAPAAEPPAPPPPVNPDAEDDWSDANVEKTRQALQQEGAAETGMSHPDDKGGE